MKKEDFEFAVKRLRENSPKRNFTQSVELIITLKGLNLKKPEEQIDAFIALPHPKGKPVKVAAFVGAELIDQARKVCSTAILDEEFKQYEGDKKKLKTLADSADYFLGQAALMPNIAKVFGRILGPKGKMPNPKAGCVVPPNANLGPLVEKLQKTVRAQAKTAPQVQAVVGAQTLNDTDLLDNITTVYNQVVHHLPGEENNVRHVIIKYSMGPTIRVGATAAQAKADKEARQKPATEKAPAKEKSPKPAKESKPKKKEAQ